MKQKRRMNGWTDGCACVCKENNSSGQPNKCTVRAPRLGEPLWRACAGTVAALVHHRLKMQRFSSSLMLQSSANTTALLLTNNDQFPRLHQLFKYQYFHTVWGFPSEISKYHQGAGFYVLVSLIWGQNWKCIHAVVIGWWWDKYKRPLSSPFTAKYDDLSDKITHLNWHFKTKTVEWRWDGSDFQ